MQELGRRGEAGSPAGQHLARNMNRNLVELVDCLQGALVDRVVQVRTLLGFKLTALNQNIEL